MQPITWSKAAIESRIVLMDENGDELKLNAGKTFIAINYPGEATFE